MDQHVKGSDGGSLTGDEWLALDQQGRAIAVEYPLRPAVRNLAASAAGRIIAHRFDLQRPYFPKLADSLDDLLDFFSGVPAEADPAGAGPFWQNAWFPPFDAISLCAFLHQAKPRRYVEVGSGNSTKFARAVIDHFGLGTEIVSVDPCPRVEIDRICDRAIRCALEDGAVEVLSQFHRDDLLFIDSSHRSFQNSDVTVFFMEVLPALADGMIYGIHDVFLPYDYPKSFVDRFYNEQYLLAAYLVGDNLDEPLLPVHYISRHAEEAERFRSYGSRIGIGDDVLLGGAFWARKGGLIAPRMRFR